MKGVKIFWSVLFGLLLAISVYGWVVLQGPIHVKLPSAEPDSSTVRPSPNSITLSTTDKPQNGFQTEETVRIASYREHYIVWSQNGLRAVNRSGDVLWTANMPLQNPIVDVQSKYILIADRGGKEAFVQVEDKQIYSVKTEQPILFAKINENGYLAIVSGEKGYKGKISVYDNNGLQIYQWFSGESYIADMEITSDNKSMVVCTADASKGNVGSGVMFFHLNDDKPFFAESLEDTMPVSIRSYNDGSVVMIGDNRLYGFSMNSKKKWQYTFNGRELTSFDMDTEGVIAVALKEKRTGFSGNAHLTIETVSKNGQLKGKYEVNGEIQGLDVNGNVVAIYQQRAVYLINTRGKAIAQSEWNRDIHCMLLMDNRREVMLSGAGFVEWLKL